MKNIYDVIIIGAGPAGLSVGIYAGRARLSTLIIEKGESGGQIILTTEVDNYPGSIDGESGASLVHRMEKQAVSFGVEKVSDTIIEVDLNGKEKVLKGKNGTYVAKSVIIATGAASKYIGCPGEKEFTGRGVSYCATCDGAFFEGLEVYVVGGSDAAVEEAMFITKFARKVTIIHRRDQLRAAKSIQQKAFSNPKIDFLWDSVVKEIKGNDLVNELIIENLKTGEIKSIKATEEDATFGIFVFIGYDPQTKLFEGILEMKNNYIVTDENMKTNVEGVFAVGDVRVKNLRQVVTATSDGAIGAVQAEKYIENLE